MGRNNFNSVSPNILASTAGGSSSKESATSNFRILPKLLIPFNPSTPKSHEYDYFYAGSPKAYTPANSRRMGIDAEGNGGSPGPGGNLNRLRRGARTPVIMTPVLTAPATPTSRTSHGFARGSSKAIASPITCGRTPISPLAAQAQAYSTQLTASVTEIRQQSFEPCTNVRSDSMVGRTSSPILDQPVFGTYAAGHQLTPAIA
ncbi:unnamed protein product [Rhizoctonia solani]|uniref:Uncharacterized protein n=1 Tax=Rhizoctonia solani TaxID=456999 RepID=A0A8H3E519_9AGAM|nr:unnamed protein product [Rhizoctonia solani]CAE7178628.1 unnamed protein product [Rhizoctonia solani]